MHECSPTRKNRMSQGITIVTGAARGIGAAIATEMGAQGWKVYVADVSFEGAREMAKSIANAGGSAEPVHLDVTDREACDAVIDQIVASEGQLDSLVNNAGWDRPEPFLDSTPETWAKVIAINYMGVIHTSHAALRHMVRRGAGRIVNIGSDAGRVGSTGEAVYSGAKGGVIAFSKTVAREVARYGIGVNVVCPGPTESPLVDEVAASTPGLIKALTRSIPMGRLGRPSDIAPAVAFLASPAAGFITGQTLSVSGGLTMA